MQLVTADGFRVVGEAFGAPTETAGEVVFNTGMTGYVEALTDPSYRGQILVLTFPLQGNYGVPRGPFESARIQVQALVVSRWARQPSHHASTRSLAQWLVDEGVPAIEAVDTRALTRHLREHGTIDGRLLHEQHSHDADVAAVDMAKVVDLVAPREITRHGGDGPRVLVIDTGAKENIIRSLAERHAAITRAPFHARWENLLDETDGVVLTNGPGDPRNLGALVERLRSVLARNIPTLGICLGHQLLALAAGARTFKLKYGHRSQNQPVMELATNRAFVTSQNHGYAVDDRSLPQEWRPTFVNLNDGTNEGIRHQYQPFQSVQFHPEAAAGPHDTGFLFDDFLEMVGALKTTRGT
jgi:carbamoyl-phosphate synthase small subunit